MLFHRHVVAMEASWAVLRQATVVLLAPSAPMETLSLIFDPVPRRQFSGAPLMPLPDFPRAQQHSSKTLRP